MRLRTLLLGTTLSLSAAASSNAALKITEAMSSSGTNGTFDWFEVTNFGAVAESVSGMKMDDGSFNIANAVALEGILNIGPGESVLFMEMPDVDDDPLISIPAFRTFWGGINSIQIGYYEGENAGVGLSSGGDGVRIWDSSNVHIDQVSFGGATTGVSFGYNPATSTFGALSVAGIFGAYNSADNSPQNVGSPGAVPEPASLGLISLASILTIRRRTHRA